MCPVELLKRLVAEARANIAEHSLSLREGSDGDLANARARVRIAAELVVVERLERELLSLSGS